MSFWEELVKTGKPIVGLSPMDGVTDAAMRYMSAKYGGKHTRCVGALHTGCVGDGVDVMFTEFVSVDALHYAVGERRERLLKTFLRARDVDSHTRCVGALHTGCVGDGRWPYEVAQVFGSKPELFAEAAILIEKLGFDGIDINMGCPAHKVEENGSGAGLIRTPALAQEIIRTVKANTKLPVSVKTRIGVDRDVAEEWMEQLMEVKPAMISLHGRTLKQLYQGSADWEAIARAAKVVHKHGGHILGNGDVNEMIDARRKTLEYGVDGVLIGRAAEGNPAIFNSQISNSPILKSEQNREQRLKWMVEHAKKFEEIFDNFMPMRKHLAWYCKGFPGAGEMRSKLVQANSADEVEKIVGKAI